MAKSETDAEVTAVAEMPIRIGEVAVKDGGDSIKITLIGVLIHYVVDGIAFAVSGCRTPLNNRIVKSFSLSLILAIALMLHKIPETFSVGTYLHYKNTPTSRFYPLILVPFARHP